MDAGFDNVYIIADSNGGRCLSEIQEAYVDTFYETVGSIAITNSKVI